MIVAGKWLLRDGRFQTTNYPQARQDLETSYAELAQKLQDTSEH